MGYRALLFCPDEKTARTVTQVLGELEFAVEPCIEPFAAVKKLMSEHFDAIVVDCDNEQNATLLFKSARNSTSNQTSLAVAVVEGQAGVAKAFRIGANLVLTKPINVEQAKGTLRVARGLLRKGEPAKPAASAPTAAVPAPAAATPAKPAAPRPVPPLKSNAPAAVAPPRPAAPPAPIPAPSPALSVPAVAASAAPAAPEPDEDLLEINTSAPAPVAEVKTGFVASSAAAGPGGTWGSGAASAPAPARDVRAVAAAPVSEPDADDILFEPAHAAPSENPSSASPASTSPEPSFTFGGANLPAESSGGIKKTVLIVVAALVVVGGLYFAWSSFQGRTQKPVNTVPAVTAPVAAQPTQPALPKPSGALPASSTPVTSVPSTNSQPSSKSHTEPATTSADNDDSASNSDSDADTKTSNSATGKTTSTKPEAAPLVVKGGKAPAIKKAAAPDAPAPSMLGIATPGAGAPPLDLGTSTTGPRPMLQRLNISQGVSQGLLMKKVQPAYPSAALAMRVEGTVELLATISKSGDITNVKVLSGDSQLSKAASTAVKQWKYKPYLLNGEPVEIQTPITINFKLPH